ncbi:DUF551 domain-containing protein [Pantoea ananatis]|uniref:DUF551 domain-containing protein n=1 Tax=Pantoea ananas TaxID=553 RepID=UPI001B30B490|nr:DUF551 domain-containing protein [Pantoea ananatis]
MIKLPGEVQEVLNEYEAAMFASNEAGYAGITAEQTIRYLMERAEAAEAEVKRLNASAQPVSDGWIRCTDSLPDSEGKYLVYETLNNRVNHDYWMEPEPAEGFWNHYDTSVTHWMPLPAAPGGQDD